LISLLPSAQIWLTNDSSKNFRLSYKNLRHLTLDDEPPPAEKITATIDAIMTWNSHNNQKFAISQTLLLKATGCNIGAIKRVLEEQALSIEQHHSQLGITPRHQSKKLHLILDFLDSQ
jgi:hypothetical protein